MVEQLRELLELRGVEVSPADGAGGSGFRVRADGRTSLVVAEDRIDADWRPPPTEGDVIVLALEVDGTPPGCVVFDLLGRRIHGAGGIVVDSVREFCRKRGIRLEPGPWRYRQGLI
jgi:hypothetical protein